MYAELKEKHSLPLHAAPSPRSYSSLPEATIVPRTEYIPLDLTVLCKTYTEYKGRDGK